MSVDPSAQSAPAPRLQRTVGTPGAVIIGLGSMLGTGVFFSLGLAAGPAGNGLLGAVALAGLLAACNALSSAQLAAAMPRSGGTYAYGYQLLGAWWGRSAGWLFLVAKSASAATAAMVVARSVGLLAWWWPPAIVAVMTLVVLLGLRRSQWVNGVLVALTLIGLGVVIVAGLGQAQQPAKLASDVLPANDSETTWATWLQAVALLFVAFTGYGRIATMAEEVTEPQRTIPRAIVATIVVTISLYLLVAAAGLAQFSPSEWSAISAQQGTPVLEVVQQASPRWLWLVQVAAVAAMLGVLLNLILGLSRVVLAMGREHDLPASCGRLHGQQPQIAVAVVGLMVLGLSCSGHLAATWSLSAVAVLGYYSITNVACLRLASEHRRFPAIISWLGLVLCLGLTGFLAVSSLLWASLALVLVLGSTWHRRWRHS